MDSHYSVHFPCLLSGKRSFSTHYNVKLLDMSLGQCLVVCTCIVDGIDDVLVFADSTVWDHVQ